jgi:hypothetical protein
VKGEGVDVGGFEGVFFRLFVLHFLFESRRDLCFFSGRSSYYYIIIHYYYYHRIVDQQKCILNRIIIKNAIITNGQSHTLPQKQ